MTKVLIATDKPFAPVAVKVSAKSWKLRVMNWLYWKIYFSGRIDRCCCDVDAMIIRSDKATKEVIDAAKKLK